MLLEQARDSNGVFTLGEFSYFCHGNGSCVGVDALRLRERRRSLRTTWRVHLWHRLSSPAQLDTRLPLDGVVQAGCSCRGFACIKLDPSPRASAVLAVDARSRYIFPIESLFFFGWCREHLGDGDFIGPA